MSVVNLGVEDSEISNSGSSSTMIGGGEVESYRELDSELLVPTLRHGKPGVQLGDCPEVVE